MPGFGVKFEYQFGLELKNPSIYTKLAHVNINKFLIR